MADVRKHDVDGVYAGEQGSPIRTKLKSPASEVAVQYDAFAEIYDRYFSDRLEAMRAHVPDALRALAAPPAAVLDCACGPGHLVLALAQHGYAAHGCDISPTMIARARRHSRESASKARFTVAGFSDLPAKIRRRFDLVCCVGNAIGHCRGGDEMVAALRGMYHALKPGGALLLDTRCWETYRAQRIRFDAFRAKQVGDEGLVWLNVRHYPRRFADPHLIEAVIISDHDGEISVRAFPITYYPFRVADLKRRLRAVGFEDIRSTYQKDADWYQITASRSR